MRSVFFSLALTALTVSAAFAAPEDGSQHSDLAQINPDNIEDLTLAFSYETGDFSEGFKNKGHTFQAVPIYHAGKLIVSTSSNLAIAIDAGTGKKIWQFDPALDRSLSYSESASRGVALWQGDSEICPARVFHGTLTGILYALDVETGERCQDFGVDGAIDLGEGIRNRRPADYSITSPVAVLDDRIIIGSAIGDNGAVDLEQGIVRALDPRTGQLLWQWDPIPKIAGDPALDTWQGESAAITGAANAWAPISVDPPRRLAFIPTSSPSPDFYGGERAGLNHYANSLVALDVDTGEVRWFQQLIHHDIWDYDIPAEPSLTTIKRDGKLIDTVVVVTKTGMLFAFNRDTGAPLFDIIEKETHASTVPGEQPHPTQPFSTVTLAPMGPVTEDDAFGMLYFDKAGCREVIANSRSEGIFTPPSFEGTIVSPSWTGGINWGGVALDESNQIAVVNLMHLPGIIKLLPRDEFNAVRKAESMPGWQLNHMRGTPYGMARRIMLSSLGLPCTKPPWGEVAAVDLTTGKILWKKPHGTVEDLAPVPLPGFVARALFGDWGAPTHGGPLTTAGNLIFIGASSDFYFRALSTKTGDELWRYRLETTANAIPMSYLHEGKQYVAIAVGGHSGIGTPRGDSLKVFALP